MIQYAEDHDPHCGRSTDRTAPCICGAQEIGCPTASPAVPSEIERLRMRIEGMALYVRHDDGCPANDLDYLDRSPCTCGLRRYHNPKGQRDDVGAP